MKIHRIADRSDIAAIEARPYDEFMPHRSIGAALEDVALRHPARRAVCFLPAADPSAAASTWTYGQFIARIRRAAQVFKELAAPRQPRVALLMPPVPQACVALWAAEAAGVVCPINPLLDQAHIADIVRASGANILVALGELHDLDFRSRWAGLRSGCPALRHVLRVGAAQEGLDFDGLLAAMPGDAPPLPCGDDATRPVALFHTGGTTGAPRLWQHTHGNQLHAAWGGAQMMGLTEHDVMLDGFPLFHVAGPLVYGLSTWLAGGCVVLPTALGMRNTAFVQRCWEFVEREGITMLAAVPTFMASLLNVAAAGSDIGSVRALFTGGAPLPEALALRFEHRFGIPVRNVLGMTECAGAISVEPLLGARVPGSCGWPIPFTQVGVAGVGGECQTSAPGASGVLCVRGPGVGRQAASLGTSGSADCRAALATGDIGHIDAAGRVWVTGRAKDLIIRGGHNIDPALIEEALLAHPDVLLAAAVGQPDEYAGELPVAYVVLKAGATVGSGELLAFVQQGIAEQPACPKRIDVLDAMPMTAIGKIYKVALRLRAMERVVSERLDAAAMTEGITVTAVDEGHRLSVVLRRARASASPPDAGALQELLSGFAFACSLSDEPA